MKIWKFLFIVSSIMVSTGCSRAQYEGKPLESIKTKPKVEKVSVLYKPLSKQESVKYLGRNWQSKGYQPVQIAIENFSSNPILFSQRGISLPTTDYETIKFKLHQYAKAKVIGIGASSATCVSIGLIGLMLAPATFGITGVLLPIGLGGAGLHATSKMLQSEVSLDQDYQNKFLHDKQIAGNSVLEGIVFVPKKGFKDKFVIKMIDIKTEKAFFVEAKRIKS